MRASSAGGDVAKVGVGAALGAVIGAAAGGGKGAAIGAGAGAAAGGVGAAVTRGKAAEIPVDRGLVFGLRGRLRLLSGLISAVGNRAQDVILPHNEYNLGMESSRRNFFLSLAALPASWTAFTTPSAPHPAHRMARPTGRLVKRQFPALGRFDLSERRECLPSLAAGAGPACRIHA